MFPDLQRELDEAFDRLIFQPWETAHRSIWQPEVELQDTGQEYLVEVPLPDVPPSEVRVFVSERRLLITGNRRTTTSVGGPHPREQRRDEAFMRLLTFPQQLDLRSVQGELREGICRIRLRKSQKPLLAVAGELIEAPWSVVQLRLPS